MINQEKLNRESDSLSPSPTTTTTKTTYPYTILSLLFLIFQIPSLLREVIT